MLAAPSSATGASLALVTVIAIVAVSLSTGVPLSLTSTVRL